MPRPTLRTRSKKRKPTPLPGGRSQVSHKKEKTSNQKCSNCGRNLNFEPHSTIKIRKLPKNQKKISRIYGGQLCHICLRDALKQATRTPWLSRRKTQ